MSDPANKDDEAALAAKVEKFRQRANARVAEIKSAIIKWLEPRDSIADSVSITSALLEIALDRHVAIHEANGFDLIEGAYQRALKRSRGPLQ
jgi:hypothetical protein